MLGIYCLTYRYSCLCNLNTVLVIWEREREKEGKGILREMCLVSYYPKVTWGFLFSVISYKEKDQMLILTLQACVLILAQSNIKSFRVTERDTERERESIKHHKGLWLSLLSTIFQSPEDWLWWSGFCIWIFLHIPAYTSKSDPFQHPTVDLKPPNLGSCPPCAATLRVKQELRISQSARGHFHNKSYI